MRFARTRPHQIVSAALIGDRPHGADSAGFARGTIRRAAIALVLLLTAGCAEYGTVPVPASQGFDAAQLAKTDIDRVAEAHQREIFASLKRLAEKLYRRNPRELRKSGQSTVDVAVARIFIQHPDWSLGDPRGTHGAAAIQLALSEGYTGDRVLAFVTGLGGMIQTAFNDKVEFFVLDDLNAQNLYNAARNVEIAVWKLSHNRDPRGKLYLLSNEASGPVTNLSFEREFGKIIASLDILSGIAADKSNRAVVKIIQSLATAVFLPVK